MYLSSDCQRSESSGTSPYESPLRENILYGYVPYKIREADFIYLSSSDKALLLDHENMMIKAFESHSTRSPKCMAFRNTLKKIEISTP